MSEITLTYKLLPFAWNTFNNQANKRGDSYMYIAQQDEYICQKTQIFDISAQMRATYPQTALSVIELNILQEELISHKSFWLGASLSLIILPIVGFLAIFILQIHSIRDSEKGLLFPEEANYMGPFICIMTKSLFLILLSPSIYLLSIQLEECLLLPYPLSNILSLPRLRFWMPWLGVYILFALLAQCVNMVEQSRGYKEVQIFNTGDVLQSKSWVIHWGVTIFVTIPVFIILISGIWGLAQLPLVGYYMAAYVSATLLFEPLAYYWDKWEENRLRF